MSKKSKASHLDEPGIEGDEWVEYGGDLIWAAGFTAGGAPYGLTLEEYRQANMESAPRAGWVRARRIVELVLNPLIDCYGSGVEIGRVRYLGQGMERKAWVADLVLPRSSDWSSGSYVVLLPEAEVEVEPDFNIRVRREAAVLARLSRLELPFAVPGIVAVFPEQGKPAVVETRVAGLPLDLRAGRQQGIRPWVEVANLAHAVHQLAPVILDDLVQGYETRRLHALAALSVLDELDEPLVVQVREWVLDHLPPDTPATIIHGDLLGQNILINPFESDTLPCIIDWSEVSLGDPAYDLAIVTRGTRRPFKLTDGLGRLVAAYQAAGGEVMRAEIHLHELCLAGRWYRESLDEGCRTEPPEQALNRLRGIFGRVQG